MRCHSGRVQCWSLCHTFGTCMAFGACILMAAAASGQEKKPTPPANGAVIAKVAERASAGQSIRQALQTKADFNFIETPLADVVKSLKEVTKLEVQLDLRALSDVGINTDVAITFSAKNMPVQTAMKLLLKQLELTWITKDNVLLITTFEGADNQLVTRVYAVQELVAPKPSYPFEGMYVPGVSSGGFPRSVSAGSAGGMVGGMGGMDGGAGGMGGGMFSVPDKAPADNVSSVPGVSPLATPVFAQLAQPPKGGAAGGMGGGGMGGAAKPNASNKPARAGGIPAGVSRSRQPRSTDLNFTMDDLIYTITHCVLPNSWEDVGGPGTISSMGGMLVIGQTEAAHEEIEKLLEYLQASSPGLKTITIRATWLLLDLKQLDQLSNNRPGKDGGIDRKALDEMAAKAKGYIGAVTCLSGQTVHIASGRNHSAVVGAVPVVGGGGGEGDCVGYQPIISSPQSGAMLQITPQFLPTSQMVLLDLCSSVTRAEISAEPIHFLGGEKADAKKDAGVMQKAGGHTSMNLDRVNVVVGQLATTLKAPLDQPTLVGGLTREPAADEKEAADTPQLYLFIEATVK